TDTLYQNADGSLNSGGVVTIGYFTSGYVITGDSATDLAAFTILSSGTLGAESLDLGGAFAGYVQSSTYDAGTITTGNALLGRPIYSFAGDGVTLAASNYFILIQVGSILDDSPIPNDYVSAPGLADPVAGYGAVGSYTGDAAGQGSSTYRTLQFVPEPTTTLLGAIGALGLLRRRRN
ncbi:MAG: hypothetical protein RIR37_475, partial [Verrucomicrobiota bacterium]